MAELEIRTLLYRAQIHDALMRYCRGVDRGDSELVLSALHPDATIDLGRGPVAPEALAEGITKLAATGTMHFIGNEYVEVDGDSAYGETYFISYATVTTDSGEPATRARAGRYLDRWARRDGEWRILRRLLVDEWSRVDELPAPTAPPPGRVGLRSKDDPVYSFRSEGLSGAGVTSVSSSRGLELGDMESVSDNEVKDFAGFYNSVLGHRHIGLGEAVGLLYPANGGNLSESVCFGRIAAEHAMGAVTAAASLSS